MSFPDFAKVQLDLGPTGPGPARDAWQTPEGLTVATAYGPDAIEGLDFIHGLPGIAPYVRGERDPRLLAALGLDEKLAGHDERARKFLEAAAAGIAVRARAWLELARLRFDDAKAKP